MSTSASSRPGKAAGAGRTAERSARPVRKASGSSQENLVRAVPKAKVRRARLMLNRVDPWSVLKLAFLLSVALGILTVVAAVALYSLSDALGLFQRINDALGTVWAPSPAGTPCSPWPR